MPREPKSTLPQLSDEEIKNLALGIFRNEIFTDRHVGERDLQLLSTIFMPLGFMDRKQKLDLQRKSRPGIFYASMANAGPRAINGYPMFFEVGMASTEDATKIWNEYNKLVTASQSTMPTLDGPTN